MSRLTRRIADPCGFEWDGRRGPAWGVRHRCKRPVGHRGIHRCVKRGEMGPCAGRQEEDDQMTVSREYLAAGGDAMTREQAQRHFHNRALKMKREILALPPAEKLRLAADAISHPAAGIDVLGLARLALAELEALAR